MAKVVIYLRVSTGRSDNRESVTGLQKWVADRGHEVVVNKPERICEFYIRHFVFKDGNSSYFRNVLQPRYSLPDNWLDVHKLFCELAEDE